MKRKYPRARISVQPKENAGASAITKTLVFATHLNKSGSKNKPAKENQQVIIQPAAQIFSRG